MTSGPYELTEAAREVLVVGFPGGAPPKALIDNPPGGFILFKRNLGSPVEVAELNATLHRAARRGLPYIGVDQEGGRVARLKHPVLELPPMRRLGEIDDPDLTFRAASVLGRQLWQLGFTSDYAPVLDVDTNPDNPVIGDRSFGRDPALVARHGNAFARGLAAAGVAPCGKHFPGHGDTHLDSHLALPRLSHDRKRLDAVELAPFRAARDIPMWMTAHVIFDALEPDRPATLSKSVITDLLRNEIGYDGVVVSDDLEMKAISDHYGIPEAACMAIDAGCDVVLICSDVDAAEAASQALLEKATVDRSFGIKLQQAAARFSALKRRFPPTSSSPSPSVVASLTDDDEAAGVAAEISDRLGA